MSRNAMNVRRWGRMALLAALPLVASSLGGCQAWNNWLDLWRWKGGAKQQAVLPGQGPAAASAEALQMLPARMVVYRIVLPLGTFSGNDKIWSQLNEDVLDSKTAVLLAQNGLRAGTGPLSRWAGITRMLDVPGAATDQLVCQTDGRSTVNVITRAAVPDQIVVSIDADLEQQGRTFSRCDDGFRLSMRKTRLMTKSNTPLPQLVVQLEPVVTAAAGGGVGSNVNRIGGTSAAFTSEEGFADLAMAATLGPDQFLVVAPQDPKGSRFSVGSLWLSDIDHVPPTETILVFVPVLGDKNLQSAKR